MLKKLILTALTLTSFTAFASEPFGSARCYSLPHGVNGQGSSNTVMIPAFDVAGSNSLRVHLTNIDSKPVNIKVALFDSNGQPYAPSDFESSGVFNDSTNTPLGGLNGKTALLKPLETGTFVLNESHLANPLTAQIRWQVDSCDEAAPLTNTIHPKVVVSAKQSSGSSFSNVNIISSKSGNQF